MTDRLPALDDRTLGGVLKTLPATELAKVLGEAIATRPGLDLSLLAVVQARLAEMPEDVRRRLLAADSPWLNSPAGRWMLAEAWGTAAGTREAALALWDGLVEQSGAQAAAALLGRAQVRRMTGDGAGALSDVIAGAKRTLDYGTLGKAARLLDRLVARGAALPGRPVRIGIVSSSTTELMPPLLRLLCARDGLAAEIYCGPFGAYRQELLDPQSGLHAFRPDFVVIALHWRVAALEPLGNPRDAADRIVAELRQLWAAAQQTVPCTVLQHAFDFPPYESAGYLARSEAGGRGSILADVNARLFAAREPGVVIVDCPRLMTEAGRAGWADDALWHVAKQHPAAPALPLLLDRYVRLMAARLGLAHKVLVLDLDNTLWGGVVGEDGPHGIKVGPPSAVGEAHAAFQCYALELKKRGVLLAVCSKNNEADAREPFRSTLGMVLKEADFVLFVANWTEKAENLRQIAQRLNLGTDSLVFVDDNPLERAKVRREMPEVAVVELPADPAGYVQALDAGGYFEALAVSQEDLARHEAYAANTRRESLKAEAGDLTDFLRRLDMRMHHGPFNDQVQERVVQLFNKTNQFNATTRRHGAAEVVAMRNDPQTWTQYFRLVDCFGDNGIIGLIVARPAESPQVWEIDSLLMSCRVLGRQAEQFMVAALLAEAQKRGVQTVRGRYIPTTKNGLVADLFPRLGFAAEAVDAGGGSTWIWNLAGKALPEVQFVRSAGL